MSKTYFFLKKCAGHVGSTPELASCVLYAITHQGFPNPSRFGNYAKWNQILCLLKKITCVVGLDKFADPNAAGATRNIFENRNHNPPCPNTKVFPFPQTPSLPACELFYFTFSPFHFHRDDTAKPIPNPPSWRGLKRNRKPP